MSLFVKSDVVRKVGLPIKEFFIWGDDIEFTRRISVRNSLPSFLVGKSKVCHAMSTNNGSNIATDDPERIARYNFAFRNENYLYRKEGLAGFAYYFAKCMYNILKIIKFSNNNTIKRIYVILYNLILGLSFNPKIERV